MLWGWSSLRSSGLFSSDARKLPFWFSFVSKNNTPVLLKSEKSVSGRIFGPFLGVAMKDFTPA
jgi:hypothetical protein